MSLNESILSIISIEYGGSYDFRSFISHNMSY